MIKILFFLLLKFAVNNVCIDHWPCLYHADRRPCDLMYHVVDKWCILCSQWFIQIWYEFFLKYEYLKTNAHYMFIKMFSANNTPSNRWKTNVFLFKRVNLSTSQAKCTKKMHSLLYIELKSWFLQYLIVIKHKMIIGLFLRIKIVAFN